jgi:putative ABC transport system ATP-binding protein
MIRIDGVSHRYSMGIEKVHALKDLSLDVEAGGCLAVVGPSGCGKSTLFHIVGGMLTPTEGRVHVDGKELSRMDDAQRADARNGTIGFVFQLFHLMPYYTAAENVELPLLIAGVEPAARKARALEALSAVGLAERAHHRPHELSGGEMQRVSIARAIVSQPRVLLADEPTGNLDRAASDVVVDLLLEMNRDLGLTVLVTTHERAVMRRFPRVLQMEKGEAI